MVQPLNHLPRHPSRHRIGYHCDTRKAVASTAIYSCARKLNDRRYQSVADRPHIPDTTRRDTTRRDSDSDDNCTPTTGSNCYQNADTQPETSTVADADVQRPSREDMSLSEQSVREQLLAAAGKMREVAEIMEQEAVRLETTAALLPVTPPSKAINPTEAETELARAEAELERARSNHVRAKTDQTREVHHEKADDRKEATFADHLRTKIHPIPMALIFVAAVIALVLVLRYV